MSPRSSPTPSVGPDGASAPEVATREGYDRWAEVYDQDANPLVALEEPVVEELLGEVRGLDVSDVGCGTGRHAVRLAWNGARVVALDFSEGMLARARQKPGAERVRWLRHDIARALPLADGSADRVICCLVLDHVQDVDGLFRELARVCREDGMIVMSVMHPAMLLKGVQARFTDPAGGGQVRVASVPNQISDYVLGATRAGLRIERMNEHAADASLVARRPRAEKYLGWPMLLTMRLGRR